MRPEQVPRRLARAALCGAALLLFFVVSPAAAETTRWWQAGARGLLVIGNGTPEQVAEVAEALVRARLAFAPVVPKAEAGTAAPLIVFVFRDALSAATFTPLYEGRAVEVGGAYLPGGDQHFITVVGTGDAKLPWRTIHHEFSHFLARQAWADPPAWFDEGLAEYHATMALPDGAAAMEVGRPAPVHLRELAREPLLPLNDLLAVTRESPLYNEGEQRGVFYAQSWLTVHYLLAGNRDRAPQLASYLRAVAAGQPSHEAFDRAFAATPAVLEKELADYLKRGEFPVTRVAVPATGTGGSRDAEPLGDADAEAWLAELLLRLDRVHEARLRLERALTLDARHARALSALGELALRDQQHGEARSLLSRASTLAADDPLVQARWGRALVTQLPMAADAAARRADLHALSVAARRILDAGDAGRVAHASARAWLDAAEAALRAGER